MDLREELLAIDERPIEEVEFPKLGRTLKLRALSGADRDRITNMYMGIQGVPMIPPLLHETIVVLGIVNGTGERVLGDEDREKIAERWGESIKTVSDAVLKLSGMAPASVEEATKNSKGDLSVDSGSGSPLPSDTL